jgi:hypothetical protein
MRPCGMKTARSIVVREIVPKDQYLTLREFQLMKAREREVCNFSYSVYALLKVSLH